MLSIKLTTVGASDVFMIPKEAKAKLNVQIGDILYLTNAPGGGMRITPHTPDFGRQMILAENIMHEDLEILRGLAK